MLLGQTLEAIGTLTLDAGYEKKSQYDVVGKLWYLAFPFFYLNNCSENVSGIDEVQFFDDIVEMWDQLAMARKIVVVAALIGNHRREGFKKILNLLSKVESIKMLTAICGMCSEEKSCFTRPRILVEPEEITIGGENEFITPLCRRCWKLEEQN